MTYRKIIGLGLLVLLLGQSALFSAGSIFMCLHGFGELHLVESPVDEDCCHEAALSIATSSHMCEGCTDLEFSRSDLFMWRESQRPVAQVVLLSQPSVRLERPLIYPTTFDAERPTRAPPRAETMARLHTRTVRWLV